MRASQSATLFVSDVHLSAARPATVDAFIGFLQHTAPAAEALYILGDLFDLWLGDDDRAPPIPAVISALASLSSRGVAVGVLHGNHDFLLGQDFAGATGCELLHESTVIELYGTPTLITHGDLMCTDDTDYQAFRRYTRDPEHQRSFLDLPMKARIERAAEIRLRAKADSALKPEHIMDVSSQAVEETMRKHAVRHLIHGHTHRPAIHDFQLGNEAAQRIVLGDWYEQDSVLACNANGCRLGRICDTFNS